MSAPEKMDVERIKLTVALQIVIAIALGMFMTRIFAVGRYDVISSIAIAFAAIGVVLNGFGLITPIIVEVKKQYSNKNEAVYFLIYAWAIVTKLIVIFVFIVTSSTPIFHPGG